MSNNILHFNHPALRDILTDLEIPFIDGYDNLSMRCFVDTECWTHQKSTLSLRCNGDHAGKWRCFRCNRRGYIDELVSMFTGMSPISAFLYVKRHQAYDDPNDDVQRTYEPVADEDLQRFAYRHKYCYERKLDEPTCLRYRLGFDQETWMITIPVFDTTKQLVAIKKRSIIQRVHQLLPTINFHPTFFGIDKVRPEAVVWVTEGEFDAMYVDQCLRECGLMHNTIALAGKELVSRALPELVDKRPAFFVDALDNDKEGHKASKALRAELNKIAPTVRFQYEIEVKDPNESTAQHIVSQALKVHQYVTSLRKKEESICL